MYLKSIEIQGFKSFAKKTTLDFRDGITGIVGPNGSGKSNIADALRWVLGEQKIKQLRGSKMEDVIFAGTENRSPLSYAYVSITFDNTDKMLAVDFPEVIIARRVYRSGESDYLLNGSPVRLKDVRELFYDTGIGKEGYSIIGQGQIDRILQVKSENRRELFDEACGIVKYKKRKAIALRKLENERLNLERVKDITSELEKRLGPLKRQSETANSFIRYKEELKSYELNLFLHESSELKAKIKECETKRKITEKELEQTKEELVKIKDEHDEAALVLSETDNKIGQIRTEISRCNIVEESLNGRINVLKEQINSVKRSQEHFARRQEELLTSISAAKEEKAALDEKHKNTENGLCAVLENKSKASNALLSVQNRNAQIKEESENLKEALIDNVRQKGELDACLERLKTSAQQIEVKKKELEKAAEDYLKNSKKQGKKVEDLQKLFEARNKKKDELEAEASKKHDEILALQNELGQLKKRLSALNLECTKAQTRLESIRNITERYEGYSGAIREVMALKGKKKGITGVVADIISTSKKYETAIETALGGSIQNIVTDNENTARDAIEYLKANKLGRATFLPLSAIKNRGEFKNTEVLDEEGVLGFASSLVSTKDRYKELCGYLLGRIIVADNIDNALRIARKYRYSFMIVTLDGELLSRGGAISGGAYKNRSNLLGRRREIDELEKEIAAYNNEAEAISGKIDDISEKISGEEEALAALNTSVQEQKLRLNTLTINLSQAEETRNELIGNYENANAENKRTLEEAGNMDEEQKEILRLIKENILENEKIKKDITRLESLLKAGSAKEEQALADSHGADMEESRLRQEESFLISSVIKAENDISRLEEELKNLYDSNRDSAAQIQNRLNEIEDINVSIKKGKEETEALTKKLDRLEKERSAVQTEDSDFLAKHDEITERISDLDKEIFRLEQAKEKYQEQFNTCSGHIWSEYELTYNSALAAKKEDMPGPAEMKSRISELKNLIRSLGTINVSAIDEYKDVKERYEFLSAQQNDILKAEEDILKIIRGLDRQMKDQFNREFAAIQEEFSRVFRVMFGGGKGLIELENTDDILESDIIITAQPPGKKLQNMMQLSGGEKALTAIAVLFAIQNLKPSPFCILDEIEAALDDSNISRFANYLSLLSEKIQFIVITHRKGTMEVCDRLYGITMQEKGISSLVSVSLEDVSGDME